MAVNTIDAELKKLNIIGGHIAPKAARILTHLVKQSREQAVEGMLIAQDYTKLNEKHKALEKDLKELKNDNRLFFGVIVTAWLAVAIMLGLVAYYG